MWFPSQSQQKQKVVEMVIIDIHMSVPFLNPPHIWHYAKMFDCKEMVTIQPPDKRDMDRRLNRACFQLPWQAIVDPRLTNWRRVVTPTNPFMGTYCGWTKSTSHPRNPGTMIPLQTPNKPWFFKVSKRREMDFLHAHFEKIQDSMVGYRFFT